jgi:hypothetical protein
MPKVKQKQDKGSTAPTVVAEFTITYAGGQEIVRSFDRAWVRSLELSLTVRPVTTTFNEFVRID